MKSSNIGGQAVIEGVMMKNKDAYAVAIRKPDGEIVVKKETYESVIKWKKLLTIPFIRGVFNFIDSLVLGMRILTYSASFYEEEEEEEELTDKEKAKRDKKEKILMTLTSIFAFGLAIGIFMVLPYFISELAKKFIPSYNLRLVLEGVIRLVIFVGYVYVISFMKDIGRLYRYHGAEHKCINCIESGLPLTVENVVKSSKEHKRCGTSFLLFVMVVGIVLMFFVRVDTIFLKILLRILLLPVIAGISYEIIRWAGRSTNPIVTILSKPGLWLQRLTTKEPDEEMIEVAIASVEAIFDWRSFLALPKEDGAAEGT